MVMALVLNGLLIILSLLTNYELDSVRALQKEVFSTNLDISMAIFINAAPETLSYYCEEALYYMGQQHSITGFLAIVVYINALGSFANIVQHVITMKFKFNVAFDIFETLFNLSIVMVGIFML